MEMADRAVELLVSMMHGADKEGSRIVVSGRLVLGDSVAGR